MPIIQAPMAGGITTPSLVAAVAKHGNAVGSFGFAYSSPEKIDQDLNVTRKMLLGSSGCKGRTPIINANFFMFPSRSEVVKNLLNDTRKQESFSTQNGPITEESVMKYIDDCIAHINDHLPLVIAKSNSSAASIKSVAKEISQVELKIKQDVLSEFRHSEEEKLPSIAYSPFTLDDQLQPIWDFVKSPQKEVEILLSFHFGLPSSDILEKAKMLNIKTGVSVTSVQEAQSVFEAFRSIDFLVAQGSEAGGHRGSFKDIECDLSEYESTSALMRDLVLSRKEWFNQPGEEGPLLVAAGGIMTGHDIRRALQNGADGIQMGTAFLTCDEAGTTSSYRKALLSGISSNRSTVFTRAFSGRLARGLENEYVQRMGHDSCVLPFPLQHNLTAPLRQFAIRENNSNFQSLWAGTEFPKCRNLTVANLLDTLEVECADHP